ncbi:MAG: hypothetical protein IJN90_00710 [Bacilli bacterium]|nr:hypothetical protein [Bacilli bacterium]
MKNKVLVKLVVPIIEENYDVYLPINKKIGNITILLCRAINEFSNGVYLGDTSVCLYNYVTGEKYNINEIVRNTDIKNGARIILM